MSVMSVMSVKLDFSTTKDDLNRLKVLLNSTKQQNGTEPASPNKEANVLMSEAMKEWETFKVCSNNY